MLITIISNLQSNKGLSVDCRLVRGLLEEWGHTITEWDFRSTQLPLTADLNIFLEVVVPFFFSSAQRNWLFVNPEWVVEDYIPHLPRLDKILCKTRYAERLLSPKYPEQVFYTGFIAEDHLDSEIYKSRIFFHNAGDSIIRGTDELIQAWEKYKFSYPLIIASQNHHGPSTNPNIKFVGRLERQELLDKQNSCLFHVLMSESEGFGHSLHEGLGCSAIVITTNAAPMAEFWGCPKELMAEPVSSYKLRMADAYKVSADNIAIAVERTWYLNSDFIKLYQQQAREYFLQTNGTFKENFKRLIDEIC
jgi:hypothetical protein